MSRRICIAVAVLLVLLVLVVAITLGVTLGRKKFKETFTARCNQFKGNNCERMLSTFERAYVGKDPCNVPPDAYSPLFQLAPVTTACDKAMFWSKTKPVVHNYVNRNKGCFYTIENTLLGSVLDGLTWCGKEGSNETFTHGCPAWSQCEANPVRSFWVGGSARFAEAACGGATVMLNGAIEAPFDPRSVFGSAEVPNLSPAKVRKLTVVLAMPMNPKSDCSNPSLKELRQLLHSSISYECQEVSQSKIEQCSSNVDGTCKACW